MSGCDLTRRPVAAALLGLVAIVSCADGAGLAAREESVNVSKAARTDSVRYTYVAGLTELSDGSVIVADPREMRLEQRNLRDTTRVHVGQQGFGPADWPHPIAPLGLLADTALVVDPINRRVLLVVGTQAVESRRLPDDLSLVRGFSIIGAINAHTLVAIKHPLQPNDDPLRDSIALLTFDLDAAVATPIAQLRRVEGELVNAGGTEALSRPAFSVAEQAASCPDGWIVVVRRTPYRVDWRRPDGAWMRGPTIEAKEIETSPQERAFYAERMSWLAAQLPQMPPEQRAIRARLLDDLPSTIPPFDSDAVRCGASGHAFIKRTLTAARPHLTIDRVSRVGERIRSYRFTDTRRWVGVGHDGVYVVHRDSMGLERIEYYTLPDDSHDEASRRAP